MLFRAFYALPDTIKGADGTAGQRAARHREPDPARGGGARAPRAVVLCFGPDAADYRVELFDGYHAERPDLPTGSRRSSWTRARSSRRSAGSSPTATRSRRTTCSARTPRRETEAGGRTLVMTGDRDMFQCAGDQVQVLYVRTGGKQGAELVDAAEVRRRYGVPPELVPDFIALRGDPSDGIPGAKGIGEKTAAELLQRHGSLEEALAKGCARRRRRCAPRSARRGTSCARSRRSRRSRTSTWSCRRTRRPTTPKPAEAARERGMERLAGRLEQLA